MLIYAYLAIFTMNFIYLVHARAQIEQILNWLEYFNELCTIALLHSMLIFVKSNQLDAEVVWGAGNAAIGIIGIIFIANFLYLVITQIRGMCTLARLKLIKRNNLRKMRLSRLSRKKQTKSQNQLKTGEVMMVTNDFDIVEKIQTYSGKVVKKPEGQLLDESKKPQGRQSEYKIQEKVLQMIEQEPIEGQKQDFGRGQSPLASPSEQNQPAGVEYFNIQIDIGSSRSDENASENEDSTGFGVFEEIGSNEADSARSSDSEAIVTVYVQSQAAINHNVEDSSDSYNVREDLFGTPQKE